jgi:hypothetical protein
MVRRALTTPDESRIPIPQHMLMYAVRYPLSRIGQTSAAYPTVLFISDHLEKVNALRTVFGRHPRAGESATCLSDYMTGLTRPQST